MWGQGLNPEHQYARIAAQRIADDLGEQLVILPKAVLEPDEPERGYPRSGSKIRAVTDYQQKTPVLLPSGKTISAYQGDRANFALTFRGYFPTDQAMIDFLNNVDERPAAGLFGEIPATFPTVTGQISLLMHDGPTADVRLLILNGGVNDLDFERIIDPTGPNIDIINQKIRQVFSEYLSELLVNARNAFPNAVIVVTGYYAAFSNASDGGDLKKFAEYRSGHSELAIDVNAAFNDTPFLGDLWDLGPGVDEDAQLTNLVWRTMYAAAQAHFQTRATIESLAPQVIGPGIIYAHPGFLAENAMFTGDRSLVYSGYQPPGNGKFSVADEMLNKRLRHIPPRDLLNPPRDLLSEYKYVRRCVNTVSSGHGGGNPEDAIQILKDAVRDLLAGSSDLPGQILLATAGDYVNPPERLDALGRALSAEIGRIETAIIASFIHPNRDGTERYADSIVTAYGLHRRFSVREATHGIMGTEVRLVLGAVLRRYGIDPTRGIRQLAQVAFIESVAIRLSGLSARTSRKAARLVLGDNITFDFILAFAIPHGRPTGDLLYAFDTSVIHLAQITELTITIGDAVEFEQVALYLNGHEVFRGDRAEAEVTNETARFVFPGS
jgi:hypothetical protein